MRIIEAQVFDAQAEGYPEEKNRLEILVMGVNIKEPDHTIRSAGGTRWTVFEYGEDLINFAHPDTDPEEGWNVGEFNASGAVEEAVFPVTVSAGGFWRELYAPVRFIRVILDQHNSLRPPRYTRGHWRLVLDDEAALAGRIEWNLHLDKTLPKPPPIPRPPALQPPTVPIPKVIEGEVLATN